MTQPIYYQQGEPFSEKVRFLNADGSVRNITGMTAKIMVAKYHEQTTTAVTINGTIDGDPTEGIFLFTATAAAMNVLPNGTLVFSRYLSDATPTVVSVATGQFVKMPAVS